LKFLENYKILLRVLTKAIVNTLQKNIANKMITSIAKKKDGGLTAL
jgi:hypothetical protein